MDHGICSVYSLIYRPLQVNNSVYILVHVLFSGTKSKVYFAEDGVKSLEQELRVLSFFRSELNTRVGMTLT